MVPTKDLYMEKFETLNKNEKMLVLCLLAVGGETKDGIVNNISGLLKAIGGTQENLEVPEAAGYIKRISDDEYKVIMSSQEGDDEWTVNGRWNG